MNTNIQYLGTAAAEGWPGIFCRCEACRNARALGGKNLRTRSQAVIDGTLLVDFPPDSYLHMLRDGLNLPDIHDILITHTHQDHFYPDDFLFRCGGFASGVEGVLTLYGNDTLKRTYTRFVEDKPNREIIKQRVACRELTEFVPAIIGGYRVTPLLANHAKNEKCFLYEIEKNQKRLFYGNDTGYFPDATWDYLVGRPLDLVSLDCTMLKFQEGTNHMGIADVLEVCKRLESIGCVHKDTRIVITHFSHNGQLLHHEIEALANPHGWTVAYDGLNVSF